MVLEIRNHDAILALDQTQIVASNFGTGFLSGGDVGLSSIQDDIEIVVAPYGAKIQGSSVSGSTSVVTLPENPEAYPRRDVIYVDSNGVNFQKGEVAPADPDIDTSDPTKVRQSDSPAPPDLTNALDVVALATVWVPAGASTNEDMESEYLRDRRVRPYSPGVLQESSDATISGSWDFSTRPTYDGSNILAESDDVEADTVDGYNGSDLGVLAEDETVSGAWNYTTRPTFDGSDLLADGDNLGSFGIQTSDGIEGGNSSISFGDTITLRVSERFTYNPGHTSWQDGLSNEEVSRYQAGAGEAFSIEEVQFNEKGGGSADTNASVEVYDVDGSSSIVSVDLNDTDSADYDVPEGNDIIIRVSNSTGGEIEAAPLVDIYEK